MTGDASREPATQEPAPDHPILGVLGGMGPAATASFLRHVVEETPARRDRDHHHVLVDSNPKIPDRIEAILGDGPSPEPHLRRGARRLEDQGATVLVIPSNTPHYFHDAIAEAVDIPVPHIVEAVREAVQAGAAEATRVGLLATTASVETGIYQGRLRADDIDLVTPTDDGQARVMDAIEAVKAGREDDPRSVFRAVGSDLVDRGADVVVGGCTEVGVVLGGDDPTFPLVDSSRALARAAVGRLEEEARADPADP